MVKNEISHDFPIQSLLSARLLLSPRISKGRVYFLSDLSGVLSLYSMDRDGSIPDPLLPLGLSLQNPHLIIGYNYFVLPKLGKVLVMIDENGNENYQPNFIPLDGGIPEPIFGDRYKGQQLACVECDTKKNIAYFFHDDRKTPDIECLQVNLETLGTTSLGKSIYGNFYNGSDPTHYTIILSDGYTAGDNVLYILHKGEKERQLLYGVPLDKRTKNQKIKLPNTGQCTFTEDKKSLLFKSTIFKDEGSITYLPLDNPNDLEEVPIQGLHHRGKGELVELRHVNKNLFLLEYNIDGCSWLYECEYKEKSKRSLAVKRTLCGLPPLDQGVHMGINYELEGNKASYVLAHAKANSPVQLFLYPAVGNKKTPLKLSNERVLGIETKLFSEGEDASYRTFDGKRVSARLYLPSKELEFKGPRPLVLYVHGGPQGQERPDFTWFSMPLIQYLTLNGFAVFVPNVRGSSGYGLKYMKLVDRDWGGDDVKDHLEGLKKLEKDSRIDSTRRAVAGRSYGGYMTLTLAGRYPELWKAACDMFGPQDLIKFVNRLPESWKTG
ncbi:MAG TPA: prolyl oligopeptidase family serine peptidase, partial [Candidatus Eisenbacteria bacterium]|nr:prolyl oligopeptidase family serine peptidase [Candidatus Eisenbacteria bacterium]